MKDKCPGKTETRRTWLGRMGKFKRHPTCAQMAIIREWDVSSLKASWEKMEHRDFARLLEGDRECEICIVDPVEGAGSKKDIEVVVAKKDKGPTSVDDEDTAEQDGMCIEQLHQEDYGVSREEEVFFFGAFPEWGVG